MGMRSSPHLSVDAERLSERLKSVVCHWRQDCIRHTALGSGFVSVEQAAHHALVLVMRLDCLPLAVWRVSLGSVGEMGCGRRARSFEQRRH
jgi:hypothetical protein